MQAAVDFVARCIASRAAAKTGGVSIRQLTKEEYDALDPKDPNTLYFVYTDSSIEQYMGDTKLTTGSIAKSSRPINGIYSILADVELEGGTQ